MNDDLSVGVGQTYKNEKILRFISFVIGCLLTIAILSIDGGRRRDTYSYELFKGLVKDVVGVDWSYHKQLKDEYSVGAATLRNKLEREREEYLKELAEEYEVLWEKLKDGFSKNGLDKNEKFYLYRVSVKGLRSQVKNNDGGFNWWNGFYSRDLDTINNKLRGNKLTETERKQFSSLGHKFIEERWRRVDVDSENLQLISKKIDREYWKQRDLEDRQGKVSSAIWVLSLILGFYLSWLYRGKRSNLIVKLVLMLINLIEKMFSVFQKSLLGLWVTSKKMKFRKQIKEGGGDLSSSDSLFGLWVKSRKIKLSNQIKEDSDE